MREKGFIHLLPLFVIAIAVFVGGGVAYKITTSEKNSIHQQVLSSSEDSGSTGSGSSGSNGSGSFGSSDSGSSGSGKSEDEKTEITTDSGVRIKTETKKDGRVRTEIRFGEGEEIKTRTEEGRTRVDVYTGGVKMRLERREDRVVISAEREDGTEVEVGEDELVQIKQRLGRINIATAGAKLAIVTGGVPALSDFPIKIDLASNALTVVTPAGEKVVTILPDQAVSNLIAANVIDRLTGAIVAQNVATRSALTGVSQIINLGIENGVPVYEITGLKDHKFLGFIPVTTTLAVTVSATTGQTLQESQSFFDNVIDFFSVDL